MKPDAPLWLPLLNAALIVISGLFLAAGYIFIRRKQIELHRRSMLTATVFAAFFLVVYVTRYLLFETRIFAGEGLVRLVYLAILISHTILAIAVGPLVLVVLRRAFRGDFARHRALARITAPVWAYVVVTGWVIYMMLYGLAL
jgi:putative membrane protein